MNYIDIHCHLDSVNYSEDREEVLARMRESRVGAITIGTDIESSKKAVEIAEANENVWACIGIHPNTSPPAPLLEAGEGRNEFETLLQSPKVVGIGECGLDFFRLDERPHFAEAARGKQKILFRKQIEFALKYDKPLMLHCRDAYDETLEILNEYKKEAGEKLRGDCHFFAGSVEQAKKFVELGFACSFTGVITFTSDYDKQIKSLPQNMIMAETDAPFVAPVPHRGNRNEPGFVIEVVKKMAEIRGESIESLSQALINNAKRTFGI